MNEQYSYLASALPCSLLSKLAEEQMKYESLGIKLRRKYIPQSAAEPLLAGD